MATLENIRKRGPLVAAVIGFALLAFILGDVVNSGSSLFSGDRFTIAEVDGEKVDYRDYEQKVQTTIENYKNNYGMASLSESQRMRIRDMVWDNMIQTMLLEKEYEELGINVSSDELFDLMQGQNVDPMVARDRAFANPQTGKFDPSRVVYFYKNRKEDPSGQTEAYLLNLEDQVTKNRKVRKLLSLTEKSLYVPKLIAELDHKDRNYLVDFNYIGKTYNEVSDSSVSVSSSDLQKYYDKHKKDYEQKASRDVVYVTFDVLPSAKDSLNTLNWIRKSKNDFKIAADNKQFVNFNSDESFNDKHFKKGELSNADVDSFMFAAEKNAIYGPYYEAGAYKLAKLIDRKEIPDSIKAKGILIAINGKSIPDFKRAKQVADSLTTAIENGVSFANVAKEYSADKQSIDNGGELGWLTEGQNVNGIPISPYNELVNKPLNKIIKVEKNFGVYLLEKTGEGAKVNKVQCAILERKVKPSTETYKKMYAQASKFAGENRNLKKFNKSISEQALVKKSAPGLSKNANFIPGLESPRQLVRWAYDSKVGNVSQVFDMGDKYVIGALTAINKEGIAPLKQVENIVKTAVLKEKKAEVLLKEFNAKKADNLANWGQKLNTGVKEAKNISFSSFQVSGLGYAPYVISNAVTIDKNTLSAPIKDENGVYAIDVTVITPALGTENLDLSADRKRLTQMLRQRIYPNPQFGGTGELIGSLVKMADIQDERAKFF